MAENSNGDRREERGAAEWITAGSAVINTAAAVSLAAQARRPKGESPPADDGKK